MKDWFLIPVMVALFVFCYYMIKKLDIFVEENYRLIATNARRLDYRIHIATEEPELLDDVSAALEYCSDSTPYLEFFLSSGKSNKILHRLSDGKLDIALLTEDSVRDLEPQFRSIRLPHQIHSCTSAYGLPVKDEGNDTTFSVVWNRNVTCKERDRVIFMIENELCSLKPGC